MLNYQRVSSRVILTGFKTLQNPIVSTPGYCALTALKFSGWWLTYPSEKYESQLFTLFPIYGKIKFMFQTPNHQPEKVNHIILRSSNYMVSFHTRSIAAENYPRVKPQKLLGNERQQPGKAFVFRPFSGVPHFQTTHIFIYIYMRFFGSSNCLLVDVWT